MIKAASMGNFQVDLTEEATYEYSHGRVCGRCRKPIQNDSNMCSPCLNRLRGIVRIVCNRTKAGQMSGDLDDPIVWTKRRQCANAEPESTVL